MVLGCVQEYRHETVDMSVHGQTCEGKAEPPRN